MRNFRVDAPVEIFSDHYRLSLVPDNTAPPAGSSSGKSLPDREPAPDRKPTGPQKPPPHPQLRTMNRRAPEPFVVFLPVARKRQADDLLDAFDMQTELLMTIASGRSST